MRVVVIRMHLLVLRSGPGQQTGGKSGLTLLPAFEARHIRASVVASETSIKDALEPVTSASRPRSPRGGSRHDSRSH
jgi:hypothetical protein